MSRNFTQELADNENSWNPYSGVPLVVKIANLTKRHPVFYSQWKQIYMIVFIKRQRQYSFTPTPRFRSSFLPTSSSQNSTTRTSILSSRIVKLSKDIALLKTLNLTLVKVEDFSALNEYSRVLQEDMDALQSFKLNFNSTIYSTDPY